MTVKRYGDTLIGIKEMDDGKWVSHEDYAALLKERDALAMENTELREQTPDVRSACMFEAIEKAEKFMDEGMPELAMVEAFEILKMKRTPATDAAIANINADGVDMFVAHIDYPHSPVDFTHGYVDELAKAFTAQLRKESTHD